MKINIFLERAKFRIFLFVKSDPSGNGVDSRYGISHMAEILWIL